MRFSFGNTFKSLKERQYRTYFIALLLMMAAVNMQMVARSQLTYDITGSPLYVGLVGAGFAPPILLLAIFGGSVSDQFNKKHILQISQLGMIILSAIIAISIFLDVLTVFHLLLAAFLQGFLWAFLVPARQSLIPELVEKDLIVNAIALNGSGMALMTFLAPGLGGYLYAELGPIAVYITIMSLFLISCLINQSLPSVTPVNRKKQPRITQMKEGIKYVFHDNALRLLILIALVTTLLSMPVRTLMPVIMDEIFSRGADAVGLMLSTIGLGTVLGSLFFAGLPKGKRGTTLIATLSISGISILLLSLSQYFWLTIIIMILMGIGDAGRRSLNVALLMQKSKPEFRGRVNGIYTMNFGFIPLGAIPIASLASFMGIANSLMITSILLISISVIFFILRKPIKDL